MIAHHIAEALLIALEAPQGAIRARGGTDAATAHAAGARCAPDVADKLGVAVQTTYPWRTM